MLMQITPAPSPPPTPTILPLMIPVCNHRNVTNINNTDQCGQYSSLTLHVIVPAYDSKCK